MLILRSSSTTSAQYVGQTLPFSSATSPRPGPIFLAQSHMETFDTVIADTAALREKAHRLRYEAYCIENKGFENPKNHPNGLEFDAYDAHSEQGLLIHCHSGLAIGSVRLIMPVEDRWDSSFPIQSLCKNSLTHDRETVMRTVEVSRMCISRTMRKQICHAETYQSSSDAQQGDSKQLSADNIIARTRSLLPYLSLGLIKIIVQVSLEKGGQAFATLDPRLLQLLTSFGICTQRIGDDVDYHGVRTPVLMVALDICENTYLHHPEVWKIISDNGRLHDLALQSKRRSNRPVLYAVR